MAINKKSSKAVEKPGYPHEFVELVTQAAEASAVKSYFENLYEESKKEIEDYLSSETCPVTVNVGEKGSNPKIDGIATVIVSQPERLDNKAAAAKIVELLKDGALNPDDLVEIVSQVNKEALSKVVDSETLASLVKKDESGDVPLQISLRVCGEFKVACHGKINDVELSLQQS